MIDPTSPRFMALFVAGALVLGVVLVYCERRDEEEHGERVCGDVDTTTPSGEHAVVRRCWRAKR